MTDHGEVKRNRRHGNSRVFHGSRLSWRLYAGFVSATAVVLAVPILAPERGGLALQILSVIFTGGAIWVAWRGLRAGTVQVDGEEVRVFGAVRTWKYELGITHFEARLVPLRFMRTPQVVLVAAVGSKAPVTMSTINSGVHDAYRHQTWVDAMVRQLNDSAD